MHIVHSIATLDFVHGGPVRAVIDLANAMHERGHKITVLTKAAPDAPKEWASGDNQPRVIELAAPNRMRLYYGGAPLQRVTQVLGEADVLHNHGVWSPHNTQFARLAHKLGTPHIVSLRGMLDDWSMKQRRLKKQLYLALAHGSWMLNNAATIHSTAEGELAQSKKWFPRGSSTVIPNLLSLDPYEQLPGPQLARDRFEQLNTDEPILLFLSRIHYKKGIEHAIRAIRLLIEQGTPHTLLIAGSGDEPYEQSLKSLVKELGLGSRVHFLGMVVGDEKLSLYQAADLFVLPTSQENFGFVLYEALAAGTPLLTTKGVDTWPELERAGSTIVDQTPEAIADAARRLTGDPENLAVRGKQGRDWIFEQMSPVRIADQFEKMYIRAAGQAT